MDIENEFKLLKREIVADKEISSIMGATVV